MNDQSLAPKGDTEHKIEVLSTPADMLSQMMAARFHMSPSTVRAMKALAATLLESLTDYVATDKFHELATKDKINLCEMIFDRAFGKPEAASTAIQAAQLMAAPDDGPNPELLGAQLDAIESRKPFPERAIRNADERKKHLSKLREKARAVTVIDMDQL